MPQLAFQAAEALPTVDPVRLAGLLAAASMYPLTRESGVQADGLTGTEEPVLWAALAPVVAFHTSLYPFVSAAVPDSEDFEHCILNYY